MIPCVPQEEIVNTTGDVERPQERHHEEKHGGKELRRPVRRNLLLQKELPNKKKEAHGKCSRCPGRTGWMAGN